jgi:ribonuclease HI
MDVPWDFFDGASQGNPPHGGVVGILHITKFHSISLFACIGTSTNNYA